MLIVARRHFKMDWTARHRAATPARKDQTRVHELDGYSGWRLLVQLYVEEMPGAAKRSPEFALLHVLCLVPWSKFTIFARRIASARSGTLICYGCVLSYFPRISSGTCIVFEVIPDMLTTTPGGPQKSCPFQVQLYIDRLERQWVGANSREMIHRMARPP